MAPRILTYNGNPIIRNGRLQHIAAGATADDCDCCGCKPNACCDGEWKCGEDADYEFARVVNNVSAIIAGFPSIFRIYKHSESTGPLSPTGTFPNCTQVDQETYEEIFVTGLDALNGTYGGVLRDNPDLSGTYDCDVAPPDNCDLWTNRSGCIWNVAIPAALVTVTVHQYMWNSQDGVLLDQTTIYSDQQAFIRGSLVDTLGYLIVNYSNRHMRFSNDFLASDGFPYPGQAGTNNQGTLYYSPTVQRMVCETPPGVTASPLITYAGISTSVFEDFGAHSNCPAVPRTRTTTEEVDSLAITNDFTVVLD